MMSRYKANPLFATLVLVMTLLLCAEAGGGPAAGGPESCSEVGDGPAAGGSESCGEVGDRPKPATVLLQQRNEKLKVEDTGMADGTRLTAGGTADLQEGILRMTKSHGTDGPYTVEDAPCPPGEIILRGQCITFAKQLGFQFDDNEFESKFERLTRFPPGCFFFNGRLIYNLNMKKAKGGRKKVTAICAKNEFSAQRVYTDTQACPPNDRITTAEDCIQKADILVVDKKLFYQKVEYMREWEKTYPAGCFKIARILWFNNNSDSPAKCDDAGSLCSKVICAGAGGSA